MGDETAEEFGSSSSSWPLIHRESLPSDADSGYEPSPAFSSAQSSFEWPPTGEDEASDCQPPPPPNEARSAAIPIPRRRQQPRWPHDAVDVATQTSSLGEWWRRGARSLEAAHPGPRATPDLLLPPPLLPAGAVAAAATTMPPDLVPRIEEQPQAPAHRLRWALAGVQLRRISDDFAANSGRPAPPPNGRRRSFPVSLLRSE